MVFSTQTDDQSADEGVTAPVQTHEEKLFQEQERDLEKDLAQFAPAEAAEFKAAIEAARQSKDLVALEAVKRKVEIKKDEEAKELQQKMGGALAGALTLGGMGFLDDVLAGNGINFSKLVQGGQHFDAAALFTPAITPGNAVAAMKPIQRGTGMGEQLPAFA